MPILNIFKNCGHYWGLSGLLIAIPLYGPWNGATAVANTVRANDTYINVCTAIWAVSTVARSPIEELLADSRSSSEQFGQFSNLLTHLNLRSLRPAGTKTRAIPRGYGFDLVSCPNYFFETIVWVAFSALTLDWACECLVPADPSSARQRR